MALIVEDGSAMPNAQSLVSVADASAILALRLHTEAWTGATVAEQEAGLAWASRILSRMDWQGFRVSSEQALAFPRTWLLKHDSLSLSSSYLPYSVDYYPADEVPAFAEEATAVEAMLLLGEDPFAPPATRGISAMAAGPLSIDFDTLDRNQQQRVVHNETLEIIAFALDRGGRGFGTKPAVRV
jgi:hypothetical protein